MIVSISFLFFAALFTFFGVLKGKKYTWVYSAVRIVGVVIAAILAMLLSRFAAGLLGGIVPNVATGDFAALLQELPSLLFVIKALIVLLVAPILFWIIFPIVYNLLNILLTFVSKRLVKVIPQNVTGVSDTPEAPVEEGKKKKKRDRKATLRVSGTNVAGMACGGVCAFLLFCVALVPMVGMVDTVNGVIMTAEAISDEVGLPSEVSEVLDVSVNNAGSVVVRNIGGRALYNGMTTYREGKEVFRLNREMKVLTAFVDATSALDNTALSASERANVIRGLEEPICDSTLIPQLGSELFSSAADSWLAGKDYHGIEMISLAGSEELMRSIVRSQKDATPDTFREDIGTLIHIVAYVVEEGGMDNTDGDKMAFLGDKALTEHLIYELFDNSRMYVVVGGALDLGVDKIADSLQMKQSRDGLYEDFCYSIRSVPRPMARSIEQTQVIAKEYRRIFEAYGLKVDDAVLSEAVAASAQGADMVQWFAQKGVVSKDTMSQKSELVTASELSVEPVVVRDKAAEAKNLAEALSVLMSVSDKISAPNMDVADMVVDFAPAFDYLGKTETVGPQMTAKIFKATLQSSKVSGQIGFSTLEASEVANTINGNAAKSSYATQMLSLSQTVRVIRNSGTADAEAAIEALIADLTPESASTLQALSTPSVVMNHGVPERSAEPVSSMMSDMFGNLSDKKGEMNDAQLQRETAAVNKVMTMAMNAGNSNGAAFGEGSATGTSAAQFVNDIMDSEVVSQTVTEQVYGDGNVPNNDPLVSQRTMAPAEEAELIAALNDKWNNATAAERADENYRRSLVSTAALMNVSVTVGPNGVQKVA